jgi:hypothetical protein
MNNITTEIRSSNFTTPNTIGVGLKRDTSKQHRKIPTIFITFEIKKKNLADSC